MLINISQNKKNRGKRISYNKRNIVITKYKDGGKTQDFYANNIGNTKAISKKVSSHM